MKAIRVRECGGPEVLRLEDIADPHAGPSEVVVRLEAIGVNVVEMFQRSGQVPVQYPFTPGGEGAGVVVAVGDAVTRPRVGDRVASESFRGTYAELAKAPGARAVEIPDNVASRVAAGVLMRGITAHYLATTTYPLHGGDRCLIHAAAGGVGLLLCQIAKRRGAWVVGTTSTPEHARRVRDAGADEVILYPKQDVVTEVKRLTNGQGVHVVYDSVGKDTFDGSLDCLARRGMLVLCGQASGPVPPLDPQVLNRKGSLYLTRPLFAHHVEAPEELAARVGELLGWIGEGWLRVPIDRTFPLADAAEAHRALEAHRAEEVRETGGKMLLIP
jgi:NADPH:quinone reductase